MFIIQTVARIGEINRLRWEDIGETQLTLWTRKAKNSNLTQRIIPINSLLTQAIKEVPNTGEYVFMNPAKDKPYVYRHQLMRILCDKAGVKRFNYHNLRHFGASLLASRNVPKSDIQAILGHSNQTTTDIYIQSLLEFAGVNEGVGGRYKNQTPHMFHT